MTQCPQNSNRSARSAQCISHRRTSCRLLHSHKRFLAAGCCWRHSPAPMVLPQLRGSSGLQGSQHSLQCCSVAIHTHSASAWSCSWLLAWAHVETWWLTKRGTREKQGTRGHQLEQEKGEEWQTAVSGGRKEVHLTEVPPEQNGGCRREQEYQVLFSCAGNGMGSANTHPER